MGKGAAGRIVPIGGSVDLNAIAARFEDRAGSGEANGEDHDVLLW
jgi:hypothetical protein